MFLVSTSKMRVFRNVILESMKNGTTIVSPRLRGIIQKITVDSSQRNKLEISKFINESTREQWVAMSKNAYRFQGEFFFDIEK